MSLDFSLKTKETRKVKTSGIFIRENGQMKEITEEEWNEKFPNRKPVRVSTYLDEYETNNVLDVNITHNLSVMACEAGIYEALWQPSSSGWKKGGDIIKALEKGLKDLKQRPNYFKKLDDPNKWGTYEQFVPFVEEVLNACRVYPEAEIEVSR